MAIDFATFTNVVPFVLRVRKPVMIRGRHGIGKSCVVYQTAEKLAWDSKNNVHVLRDANSSLPSMQVIERRASQMTEGDLVGLPVIDGDRTRFNPPDWLKTACEEPVVLFLDEIDRAVNEVRQGFFELTDSRKIHGQKLHPGTLIFAAVNGGEGNNGSYMVHEMDPAELDRWTCFDVDPSAEDWLMWATGKVDSLVWDFINGNREHLEHKNGDFEPNKKYPSRRSWDRLGECLNAGGLTKEPKESATMIFNLSVGFVGFEAAVAFSDFCRTYERQVTVEDILDHGRLEKFKAWTINEHTAMVDKMDASGRLKEVLTPEQVKNLAGWFIRMPSEVAMKLWTVVGGAKNEAGVKNSVALHQMKVTKDDGSVIAVNQYLVEALTGAAMKK